MANTKSTLSAAIGTAFAASIAVTPAAHAAGNPFAMQGLDSGHMVAAMDGKCGGMKKAGDGKCGSMGKAGDGKCGMSMMDANKDGKVSKEEFMKMHEGIFDSMDANKDGVIDASEMKAAMDGKCGQGKCGAMKK